MKFAKSLGLAVVVSLLCSMPVLASNEKVTFGGGIGFGSPCDGSFISATGPVDVMVQTNENGQTPLVSVHMRFKADGSSVNGDPYQMSFLAEGNFDAVSGTYDIPYDAVLTGKGSVPNIKIEGIVRIFVTPGGAPTGANILTLDATCQVS